MTIQNTRIQSLNNLDIVDGKYVLYWMQQSQRAECNHALEYAIQEANRLKCGLLVAFGLTDSYPEANLRHYAFMLEGLRETKNRLADRGVQMVLRICAPRRRTAGRMPLLLFSGQCFQINSSAMMIMGSF
jgi:deoxyribodipyrimidine photo-lyase